MSNAIVPYETLQSMAAAFAKSGLFGVKTPDQALALLLLAQGEGLHPALAIRDFDIIQGRPAKKAEAILRSFIAAGGKVEWHEMTDERADATFSHPQGGTLRIDWDMKRAKQAGVGGKDMYSKYPRQMLANRVISEGCRRVYPASTSGMYVPDEIVAFRGEKDITPSAGAMSTLPIKRQQVVMETAAEVRALLAADKTWDAYAMWQASGFDADEKVAFWSQLDSKQKGVLGRMREEEQAKEKNTISPQQKKRLEAIIKESGQDRETVKAECVKRWGTEHFSELTREQYQELTTELAAPQSPSPPESIPSPSAAGAATQSAAARVADGVAAIPSADDVTAKEQPAADPITEADIKAIRTLLELKGISENRFLTIAKVTTMEKITQDRLPRAKAWLAKQ